MAAKIKEKIMLPLLFAASLSVFHQWFLSSKEDDMPVIDVKLADIGPPKSRKFPHIKGKLVLTNLKNEAIEISYNQDIKWNLITVTRDSQEKIVVREVWGGNYSENLPRVRKIDAEQSFETELFLCHLKDGQRLELGKYTICAEYRIGDKVYKSEPVSFIIDESLPDE